MGVLLFKGLGGGNAKNGRLQFICIGLSVASLGAAIVRESWMERGSLHWLNAVWGIGFAILFWTGYALVSASRNHDGSHTFQKVIFEVRVPGWLFSSLSATVPFAASLSLGEQLGFQEFMHLALLSATMWVVGLVNKLTEH